MKTILGIASAAILASALATPAAAQVAGLYTGTSADGQNLQFTVSTDANTGKLAVTAASIGFSAPCRNSTYIFNSTWGIGLLNDIAANGKVAISSYDNYFTFAIVLDFASDGQSATGTISSISPTLSPVGKKPTQALYCTSPKQSLTLALQPAAAAAPSVKVNQQAVRSNDENERMNPTQQ